MMMMSFRNSTGAALRVLAVFLLLTCFGASQQKEEKAPAAAPVHALGTRRPVKGVPNFGEVTPNLYRGALPDATGYTSLKEIGVDIVVDLRGGSGDKEKAGLKKLGIEYVSIPSHCPFPSDDSYAKFLRVIRENRGKKIFVHCRLGEDRTGMAVAAYRMAEEGWTAKEAMKEMQEFGFSARHRAMCPMMASYEAGFPERLKKNPAFAPDPEPAK